MNLIPSCGSISSGGSKWRATLLKRHLSSKGLLTLSRKAESFSWSKTCPPESALKLASNCSLPKLSSNSNRQFGNKRNQSEPSRRRFMSSPPEQCKYRFSILWSRLPAGSCRFFRRAFCRWCRATSLWCPASASIIWRVEVWQTRAEPCFSTRSRSMRDSRWFFLRWAGQPACLARQSSTTFGCVWSAVSSSSSSVCTWLDCWKLSISTKTRGSFRTRSRAACWDRWRWELHLRQAGHRALDQSSEASSA